jgi:L-arabinonolactonase
MGFASGLAWWDPEKPNESVKICDYEPGLNTRPNDGKCDRQGNFVIGSYNNNHREDKLNIAGLWRLGAKDSSLQEILDYRFRCSNTIAFSPSGDHVYFCDTPTKAIYKFNYSPSGALTGKTLFYQMADEEPGGPDGATVDAAGGLWEAQAGNWRVVRHRPSDGRVDYEVVLPCNNPTSCAIAGDTLYITTARHRLTEEQRKAQPGAGQLWAVQLPPEIRGLPEPVFAG